MNRVRTIEEIEFLSVLIFIRTESTVAYHCEAEGQPCDRYYAHEISKIPAQAAHALEAAIKNGADGVLVLPYPNTRRTSPNRSHE